MRPLRLVSLSLALAALPISAACGGDDPAATAPPNAAGSSGAGGGANKAGAGGVGAAGAAGVTSLAGAAGTSSTGGAAGAAAAGGSAGKAAAGTAGSTGDMTGFGGSSITKGGASGAAGASSGAAGATAGAGGGAGASGSSGAPGSSGASGTAGSSSGAAGAAGSSSGLSGGGGTAGASAGQSGSGGAAGSPGGSSGAGGTSSGGASGASAGGAGGAPGTTCGVGSPPCAADAYCDDVDHVCRSCGDLGSVRFGKGTSRFAPSAGVSQIDFPRVGVRESVRVLSYRARGGTAQDDIFARTLQADGSVGAAVSVNCCVNKSVNDSGALLLPAGITGETVGAIPNHGEIASSTVPFVLVDSFRDFDRASVGGGRNPPGPGQPPRRRVHIAQWDLDPSVGGDLNGYGPVPLLNSGLDDFSVAFASGAPAGARRFYWMSTRGTPEQTNLRTVLLGQNPSESAQVSVVLEGCGDPVVATDFRPWLTPEGTHLIFNARCLGTDPWKLWITTPAPNGTLPAAKRLEIADSPVAADETAGSLSPNKCELWFMRGGEIHSASRRLSRKPLAAVVWMVGGFAQDPQRRRGGRRSVRSAIVLGVGAGGFSPDSARVVRSWGLDRVL